jgi:hypothetical protein
MDESSPSSSPTRPLTSAAITNSHSECFKYHPGVPEVVSPHSAVLLTHTVSFPALWRDNSVDHVTETQMRKTAHKQLLTQDPTAFRKKAGETAEHFARKHATRDLLNNIHIMSDPNDLVPHRYTFSRRAFKDSTDLRTTLEDFLQPRDPTRPRSTGYSTSLLRSMVQFDTFGPQDSMATEQRRNEGDLPPSPIHDRNRHLRLDLLSSKSKETSASHSTSITSSPFSPHNSEYQIDPRYVAIKDPRTRSRRWYSKYAVKAKVSTCE